MTKRSGWNNDHKRMSELPRDWSTRRRAVIARDKVCVICGQPGRDVDHIDRGNDHRLQNLRLLCRSCHMKRTGRDGGTARRRPKRQHRPPAPHPGLLDTAKRKERSA